MSIKAVIFDFFGVISSEVAPFWFSERFPDDEAKRLKDEYMSPADRGDVSEEELFEALSRLTGESAAKIEADFERRVCINKEMVELIEALGKSCKTALLSNAMAAWLEDILIKNDLNRLFEVKIISGTLRIIKPEREIFEAALKKLGIKAEEAIFIDDNIKNVNGAKAVGINGILYTDMKSLISELSKFNVEISK